MEILVILLLILLNGLFAMSEIALISARRSNLEMQARQGSAGARQALKLAKDPDRFLSTVQIGITLIGILTGIYSGDTLAAKFGGELARLGIPLRTATVTAQVTIVIAVTYLTIIFGELVPKRIGMNAAERAAKIVAQPMRLLSVAASPFVWLLSRSTAGVARLLGLQRAESKVTEAEIRSIIQEGAEDGEVQAVEQQIMGRVFSLGDRTVESIMTHRSELAWIDAAASAAQIRETVARAPHNATPSAREVSTNCWAWSASKTSSCTWATRDSTCAGWSLRRNSSTKGSRSTTPSNSCARSSWATASSATNSA